MLAHLKHRVLLAALFAVGLTLGACATEPNASNDQATTEQLIPVKAKPEMKATRQFQVRGAKKAAPQLRARLQLQALRAK